VGQTTDALPRWRKILRRVRNNDGLHRVTTDKSSAAESNWQNKSN
jgi:hypothetical protein